VTLRQLRYFLAVVEAQSITRAASSLHVAQPSLSQQLRELERHLGGPLVERLPRSIQLTALGRAFEPHARSVVLAAERAEAAVRAELAGRHGELEIATVRSIAVGLLPPSISAWHRARPGVSVRLHEFGHRSILEERVRDGLADLAIGPRPQRWSGPVESFGWEEFVVVLPAGDPLADGRASVSLGELRDRGWVLFTPEHGLSDVLAFAFASAGYVPAVVLRTAQVEAAARLAAAGLGPALLPADAVPPDLEEAAVALDPPLAREVTAYARTAVTPLAEAYLQVLRKDACWRPPPEGVVRVP